MAREVILHKVIAIAADLWRVVVTWPQVGNPMSAQ
jgi:hypothetical protein